MANIYGRQVVVPMTNKSGGGVIAGDVVIVDTTNDTAFTTTTSGGFTGFVGVAQETIASNASGRVLTAGYAALVNVNASVTRGQYGKTHTVAKQATGTASRGVGTFCQWLTGGTTPTAMVYPPDLNASAGNVATDAIWDAAGDLAVGTGADTAAKLTIGASGKVLGSNGTTASWVYPPGYELDYVEKTSNTSITATSEATANTHITSSSVTYDGAAVAIEVWAAGFKAGNATGGDITVLLRDDTAGTVLGDIAYKVSQAANDNYVPLIGRRRLTPAAGARVYSIRAFVSTGTGVILGAAGGTPNVMLPAFIRITKV